MRTLIRGLFWLALLAVIFATLAPIDYRPVTIFPAQAERFGAFLAISILLVFAYPRQRFAWVIGLVAVAGLLEVLQNVVPGRHGRLLDFEAKAVGAMAGAIIGVVGELVGSGGELERG